MKLFPFDAPTNASRFARLARAGTFNGLTFHRVAPFFVVQGPSPNANEYSAPDKPFARDELGVSNIHGTVGLSTRGRDTADGQIYINTVDNVWLDHEYTVMGAITSGLEVFDRMQEGARIRRITITP
jgi:cyclophilin family peptidyl-prolyl cis-trans isomerase